MIYNLHSLCPTDFHPEKKVFWPDFASTNIGIFEQRQEGIYNSLDEDKKIISPFNIACYSFNDKLHIQIFELNEDKADSTATTFCSPLTTNNELLPKAAIQAMKYVFDNFPDHASILFHVIITIVAVELFEDELVCWGVCLDRAYSLFEEVNSKESALTPVDKSLFQFDDVPF